VLKTLLKQKKSLTPAYGLFAFTVIMIGFSAISGITFSGGGGFSKTLNALHLDSSNTNIHAALGKELDQHLNPTNTHQLSPQTKTTWRRR